MKRQRPDVIHDRQKYHQGWTGGLPETPCGSGSKLSATVEQRAFLHRIVQRYGIKTVADIGAGDLNWIRHMQWEVDYQPFDLVPRRPEVRQFDLVEEVPPKVDMVMCLWVLNHFPEDNARSAIENLVASGSKYLAYTWDSRLWEFLDLPYIEQVQIKPAKPDTATVVGHRGVFLRLVELA